MLIKKVVQLQHLQSLYLEVFDETPSLTEFLVFLTNSLPNLRHVGISFFSNVILDSELFKNLLNSKWESFQVDNMIIADEDFEIDENINPNVTLRTLKLQYEDLQPDVAVPFVTYFQNLEHLELHNISNEVMLAVNKYQVRIMANLIYRVFCA